MLLLRFVSDLDQDAGLCGSAAGVSPPSAPSVPRAEGAVPAVGVKTHVLQRKPNGRVFPTFEAVLLVKWTSRSAVPRSLRIMTKRRMTF